MRLRPLSLILAFAAAASLVACGGGKKAANSAPNGMANGASPVVSGAPNMAGGAAANGMAAAVPGSLHCGSQPPVWVNSRTHVYHVSGDQYYGRTKNGQYMCMQDAVSAGYHPAGSRSAGSHHHKGSASGGQVQPESSPAQ